MEEYRGKILAEVGHCGKIEYGACPFHPPGAIT